MRLRKLITASLLLIAPYLATNAFAATEQPAHDKFAAVLVPNIESGNMLYKSLILFSQVKVAALILGAKAPIVLTSRSDSEATKLNSILLAAST